MEAWSTAWLTTLVMTIMILVTGSQGEDDPIQYYILEELPPNTLIGNVGVDAGLSGRYNSSVIQLLRYSFLDQSDPDSDLFGIDERTGVIRTTKILDRDVLCPHQVTCWLWLHVAVRPAQHFQVIKIVVDVLDINDHQPVFPQAALQLQVLESVSVGSSFSIPTPSDIDSAAFGIQSYELLTTTETFELKVSKSIDGSTDLRLILKEQLDREVEDFYHLVIVAHDGGTPSRSGSIVVNVTVEDANDNEPHFENATYEVFVLENVPVGVTVAKVRAQDPDEGPNGKIVYGFSANTKRNYGDYFGINNETGAIYLLSNLDYEKATTFLLVVTAQDLGPDSSPSQAAVVLRVEDANDNAPHITVNTLTATGFAQISEGADPEIFVVHVSVTDQDSGKNGEVICSVDDPAFAIRSLDSGQYKVVNTRKLDREVKPKFDLVLTCEDRGVPNNSASANITVKVTDENDQSPVFLLSSYNAHIKENNYVDEIIVKVKATDLDEGPNGEVRYRMHEDARNMFNVHPVTGLISANVVFDHEKVQSVTFRVVAFDLGSPSLSGTTTVVLDIEDLNDEAPKFSQASYAFGTFESRAVGTEVGRVSARDPDSKPFNHFGFLIKETSREIQTSFHIDSQTGKITTKLVLDRERTPVFYFTVLAENKVFPPMTSSVSVTVYVADHNDNRPIIDYPTLHNNTVHMSNLAPIGHEVAFIQAHDIDLGINAKLVYSITDGNKDGFFDINPSSGLLSVALDISRLQYQEFRLTVTVRDRGTPFRHATAKLTVVVSNSIAFNSSSSKSQMGGSLTIIIALVTACVLLIFVLVLAVLLAWRRVHRRRLKQQYYHRTESQHMLRAQDSLREAGDGGRESSVQNSQLADPNQGRCPPVTIVQPRTACSTATVAPVMSTFITSDGSARRILVPTRTQSPLRLTTNTSPHPPPRTTSSPPKTISGRVAFDEGQYDMPPLPKERNIYNMGTNAAPSPMLSVSDHQNSPAGRPCEEEDTSFTLIMPDGSMRQARHPALPDGDRNHKGSVSAAEVMRQEQDGESSCSGHTSSADSGRGPSDVELQPRPPVYPEQHVKAEDGSTSSEYSEEESDYASSCSELSQSSTEGEHYCGPGELTLTLDHHSAHDRKYMADLQGVDLDAISEESADCFI